MPSLIGELNVYHEQLILFDSADVYDPANCYLVFIAGLTEGFLATPYITWLAHRLKGFHTAGEPRRDWSLVQILLSSSYKQYGLSSLHKDAEEIAKAVGFLRRRTGIEKIVLMGHSTGCQDAMYYLTRLATSTADGNQPPSIIPQIDGAILQAPVSDREAFETSFGPDSPARKWVDVATEMVKAGKGQEWMPKEASASIVESPEDIVPFTAYRFWSLHAEGGDDDFFTTTLPDSDLYFSKSPAPLLLLLSEQDEYYPPHLINNKAAQQELIARWRAGSEGKISELSCVIGGASHSVRREGGAADQMIDVVLEFLRRV